MPLHRTAARSRSATVCNLDSLMISRCVHDSRRIKICICINDALKNLLTIHYTLSPVSLPIGARKHTAKTTALPPGCAESAPFLAGHQCERPLRATEGTLSPVAGSVHGEPPGTVRSFQSSCLRQLVSRDSSPRACELPGCCFRSRLNTSRKSGMRTCGS